METILKYERVVLVKELNEKFRKVGEVFEIASVLDNSFVLRDARTRVALGIISFEDFERCFVKEEEHKEGWTQWTQLVGFDGRTDAFYKTNGRRVEVKFVTDKVRAVSCCHKDDEFNLYYGIQIAYCRCENKVLLRQRKKYKEELQRINMEISHNKNMVNKMINALEGK